MEDPAPAPWMLFVQFGVILACDLCLLGSEDCGRPAANVEEWDKRVANAPTAAL
jgi:hypothetical protein